LMEVAKITKGRYYGLTMEGAYGSLPPRPEKGAATLARPLIQYLAKGSASAI